MKPGTVLIRAVLLPVSLIAFTFASIGWIASTSVLWPLHYRPGDPGGVLPAVDDTPQEDGPSVLASYDGLQTDPLEAHGFPFEDVRFFTEGAATLRGWYVPGRSGAQTAVVVVHGAWLDRREFLNRLPLLHDAGYPVLLFDCREHGISDGRRRGPSFGPRESADVIAAARWLRAERGITRVVAFGQSLGGAAAILAAAADPGIDAVIAENAFARFDVVPGVPEFFSRAMVAVVDLRAGIGTRIDPVEVVDRIAPRPLLLLHGTSDRVVPSASARALLDRAGEPKSLWLVPGGQHDQLMRGARDAYRETVLGFLARRAPLD